MYDILESRVDHSLPLIRPGTANLDDGQEMLVDYDGRQDSPRRESGEHTREDQQADIGLLRKACDSRPHRNANNRREGELAHDLRRLRDRLGLSPHALTCRHPGNWNLLQQFVQAQATRTRPPEYQVLLALATYLARKFGPQPRLEDLTCQEVPTWYEGGQVLATLVQSACDLALIKARITLLNQPEENAWPPNSSMTTLLRHFESASQLAAALLPGSRDTSTSRPPANTDWQAEVDSIPWNLLQRDAQNLFGGSDGRLRHDQDRADAWNADTLIRDAAPPPGLATTIQSDEEDARMQEDISSGEGEYLAEIAGMTAPDSEGTAMSSYS